MKYINLSMFLLSFTLFSIMTTDLLMAGNHWGLLQIWLYVAMAVSASATGYAHLALLSVSRPSHRRRR